LRGSRRRYWTRDDTNHALEKPIILRKGAWTQRKAEQKSA